MFTLFVYYINLSLGLYNNRYIVATSLLYSIAPFLILKSIFCKIKNINISKSLLSLNIIILVLYTYHLSQYGNYPQMNYINFKDKHVSLNNLKIRKLSKIYEPIDLKFADNSTVLLLNIPISLLVINQNPSASYIGIPMEAALKTCDFYEGDYSKFLVRKIDEILKENKKIYLLYVNSYDEQLNDINNILNQWSTKYKRQLTNCENIDIKFFNSVQDFFKFSKCEYTK